MITPERFAKRLQHLRQASEDLAAIPELREACPAYGDAEFWRCYDAIELAGRTRDASKAPWLAGLTQIDGFGPMGRALHLSQAALLALTQIPDAALEAAKAIWATFPANASPFRRVGLCFVLEACGRPEALRLMQEVLETSDEGVQQEVAAGWWAIREPRRR